MQYYSEELTLLSYALEDGIEVMSYEVVNSSINTSPNTVTQSDPGKETSMHIHIEKLMLWMDNNVDDPALSRICLVKQQNLEAYKNSLNYIQDRQQRESNSTSQDWYITPSRMNRKPRGYTILEEEDERLSKGSIVLWWV